MATAAGKSVPYRPGMELEPGEYQIQVTHQGYRPEQRQVTLKENLQLAIGLSHSVGTTLAKSQLPQALAPTITIQRYCTLEAPDEVIADQEFAIQVALTVEQITPEVKLTPYGRTRALARCTPWSRRCILDTPAWACRRYMPREIWPHRQRHQ